MKKPFSVKFINALLILRLFFTFLIFAMIVYVLYNHPEDGFWKGVADAIIERLNVEDPTANPAYTIAYSLGLLFFPCILLLSEYYFLNNRKRTAFWIMLGLDILFTLSNTGFPFISILILIMALQKSTSLYFNSAQDREPDENVLDDAI